MNVPFDMKKLALITINGNGLSIAFGNPKKAMSNSISLFEGASSNWIYKMVFPRRRKPFFCHECVALTQSEFLVNFRIPEKLNSYIEERCLLLRYPTHIFFSLSLILRERGHHELPVFSPLIFLRLLASQEEREMIRC
jgi:hypothetical protein